MPTTGLCNAQYVLVLAKGLKAVEACTSYNAYLFSLLNSYKAGELRDDGVVLARVDDERLHITLDHLVIEIAMSKKVKCSVLYLVLCAVNIERPFSPVSNESSKGRKEKKR